MGQGSQHTENAIVLRRYICNVLNLLAISCEDLANSVYLNPQDTGADHLEYPLQTTARNSLGMRLC